MFSKRFCLLGKKFGFLGKKFGFLRFFTFWVKSGKMRAFLSYSLFTELYPKSKETNLLLQSITKQFKI